MSNDFLFLIIFIIIIESLYDLYIENQRNRRINYYINNILNEFNYNIRYR